jgi:DNA-binding MarR family transcriptional regulator
MDNLKLSFLTPFRLRIMWYLDQKGPTHRGLIAQDLSPPDSSMARGCYAKGNGARLVGAWTAPLVKHGLIKVIEDGNGFYREHALTDKGRKILRGLCD